MPKPAASKDWRELLMAKLREFRQWRHDLILRRTQADPAIGRAGLTEWKAAGSTTLTSDFDVNLKGNKTELAVAVFNRLFKADGWEHEAGVVYDVNVYAVDFMHKDIFRGLAEQKGKTTIGEAGYKAGKYLWRMADAAKNLDSKDTDIAKLYEAGFTIANEIKGGNLAQAELERRAGAARVRRWCGAGAALVLQLGKRAASPKTLMDFVRRLAARVALAHTAQIAADQRARAGESDALTPAARQATAQTLDQASRPSLSSSRAIARCSASRLMQWLASSSAPRQTWRTALRIAPPHNSKRWAMSPKSMSSASRAWAGRLWRHSSKRCSTPGTGK